MNCSRCGEVCHCHPEPPPSALPQCGSDTESPGVVLDSVRPENDEWRDELSARLDRYRARRKVRPPRYPSLRLPFEQGRPFSRHDVPDVSGQPPVFETTSNHALALDSLQPAAEEHEPNLRDSLPEDQFRASLPTMNLGTSAKIIEFPRFWTPPMPQADQLAEPVSDRPRILEVPESVLPPPALGGIMIESTQAQEIEKRPGIDTPLQSAPLTQRLLAAVIDALIIAAAAALFGFIFWKVAAVRPPTLQIVGLAAGVFAVLWAAYQYLLIIYGGSTPGLRLAGLQLSRFDGSGTNRRIRRWRILGSFLSAASLGMGYAWVFLDEDMLCWHDRITHTYLAPMNRAATDECKES